MTVGNEAFPAGAASKRMVDWHGIDWAKASPAVRRLQARIVKAVQAGCWGKVKALQRLLTHSFYAKCLAVRRVTENRGRRTPGVDGAIWRTPESKGNAVTSLGRKGYSPFPLRRLYIPKSDGKKKRPLGIPAMKDRAMQALHLLALVPVAETLADPNSYGFRPERSCADAIEQCYRSLSRYNHATWVLDADISGCFDNISHDWLLCHIPMDKKILGKWLKAGFIWERELFSTEAGTPQGGIISPTLANMTLDGMERLLRERFLGKGNYRLANPHKINFIRYADDFVVTGDSREILEEAMRAISEFLSERGLSLSPEKTRIRSINDGFDFLGWNVRKYGGKLLIKPSKKNVCKFLLSMRETIKKNATAKTVNLIRWLNPKVTGWANYHRNQISSETFSYVDNRLWQLLWRWSKRRHSKKSSRWVKEKYFPRMGTRNWLFNAKFVSAKGEVRRYALAQAGDVHIRRHHKIKGEANPYDPEWETYFEKRFERSLRQSLTGKGTFGVLRIRQGGICPICREKLDASRQWDCHHILPRHLGGTDSLDNLVLLHSNCHRLLHNRESVVSPARHPTEARA